MSLLKFLKLTVKVKICLNNHVFSIIAFSSPQRNISEYYLPSSCTYPITIFPKVEVDNNFFSQNTSYMFIGNFEKPKES